VAEPSRHPASDLTYASALELSAAMAAGAVSALELTQAAIARITQLDEDINAVCVPDFERALSTAHDADEARGRGDTRPLLGVPITVKESFNIAGLPTTWGLPPFRDFIATTDAVAVQRLKAAGAVVLGKTNVPLALGDLQTYNAIYGTTNNPWDVERTPGGSSGGSAAALAAGFGAVSIGSDIAGSLRVPAHFCGIYAHKPTHGLLPSRGHTPPPQPPLDYNRDLTVIGPMARSAADLNLLVDVLAGPDNAGAGLARRHAISSVRANRLSDFRILILDTHPLIPSSSDIRDAYQDLAVSLRAAGAQVWTESPRLPDLAEGARLYMRLLLASLSASYPDEMYEEGRSAAAVLAPTDLTLAAERTRGAALTHRDWLAADSLRTRHLEAWRVLFSEFDVVLCPASPTTAFAHDHSPDLWNRHITIDGALHDYADQLVWAGIASAPGLPATVAPIAISKQGLPIGVQIIGPMFEDRTPLRFAELLEHELGGFTPPPALA
jgi:amidase